MGMVVLVGVCLVYSEPLCLREGLASTADFPHKEAVQGIADRPGDLDLEGTRPTMGSSQPGQTSGDQGIRPLEHGIPPDRPHGKRNLPTKAVPRANARACGCDPWSEHCVVPPHDSPGYGCIRAFDDHEGDCGGTPHPNDGPWVQWGFGHGHPLTGGHSEEETKKIATAVFGADSDITHRLKNEAVRRDARASEAVGPSSVDKTGQRAANKVDPGNRSGVDTAFVKGGVMDTSDEGDKGVDGITQDEIKHAKKKAFNQSDALKSLPPLGGARDLALHPHPPKPATQCGNLVGTTMKKAAHATADAVYADPITTYTDMPVHLPTQHDLYPKQDGAGGRCRPSVTGIFQECGPWAALD